MSSPTQQMQTNPTPEFINQSILTRSWELLRLLFVGITVSYGLFSRRNIEFDKESNQLKFDTSQSYVSRILEVTSVFYDEVENLSPGVDRNKTQIWNSHYFNGESMVMVMKERSGVGKCSRSSHGDCEKPLLLPVRSLKLHVSDIDEMDSVNGEKGFSVSSNGSSLALDGSSVNYKMGNGVAEIEGWDVLNFEEKMKESDLLPSPISWRSQSGRMESKNEEGTDRPLPCSHLPSAAESEFVSFESPPSYSLIHQAPQQNSPSSPSPEKHSSVSPLLPEVHPKNWEDFGKINKRSGHKPSPSFPSVPVSISAESPPRRENANLAGDVFLSDKKDMGSSRNEVEDFSRDNKEGLPTNKDFGVESLRSETKSRRHLGKSVRTIRARKYAQEVRKCRENMHGAEINGERRSEEVDGNGVEKTGASIEKPTDDVHLRPRRNHHQESAERMIEEPKDSDSSNYSHESSDGEVSAMGSGVEAEPNANEVDKKADEFIAKFKEQIRLQRIREQRSRRDSW